MTLLWLALCVSGASQVTQIAATPDYIVQLPVDDVVIRLPVDDVSVLLPADDEGVIV